MAFHRDSVEQCVGGTRQHAAARNAVGALMNSRANPLAEGMPIWQKCQIRASRMNTAYALAPPRSGPSHQPAQRITARSLSAERLYLRVSRR
jgi:hypothetical protein